MRIAIIDDDIKAHENLKAYLNELLGNSFKTQSFISGEQFLSIWKKGDFDLIILDIFMNKITGMEVAHKIRETDTDVRIVFNTTSNEFASESYEVNACYYLHKPFSKKQIEAMLGRLDLDDIEKNRTVTLPDNKTILLRDIIYADFYSHKVTFHCKHNDDIIIRTSFSEIEPILCANPYFFCPSKGVIVNFYEVSAQTKECFTMSDNSIIPISRRKAKDVLEAYSSFCFNNLRGGAK